MAAGDPTCDQVFQAIPARFVPEGAPGWNATIQFKLSGDGGGEWVLKVKDGACVVDKGSAEAPTATVITSAENWVGMSLGRTNPMMVFMTGQLQVQGNIGDVMKLQQPAVFKRAQ